MNTIAIISDIHGNLPALEAVLADIQAQGIAEVYHLGDLVGYNPFPNETAALVDERRIPGITGNYDQAVLALVPDPIGELLNTKISPMGKEIYAWTVRNVTPRTNPPGPTPGTHPDEGQVATAVDPRQPPPYPGLCPALLAR